MNISLALSYSYGSEGMLGLPNGWSYSIPYINVTNKTLNIAGQSYIINPNWQSSSGYASGLSYVNNESLKFVSLNAPSNLPKAYESSVQNNSYLYRYTDATGNSYYFDSYGKLLQIVDVYGNYIDYYYLQSGGVSNNNLVKIVDSFGQSISFSNNNGQLTISLPDGSNTIVDYNDNGVSAITNALGQKTDIDYSSLELPDKVLFASGLETEINYAEGDNQIKYAYGTNQLAALPNVSSVINSDLNGVNGKTELSRTNYTYGYSTSGHTFTGYTLGGNSSNACTMSINSDCIMNNNNGAYSNYQYDTLVSRVDSQGNVVSEADTIYNYLHAPVSVKQSVYQQNPKTGAYEFAYGLETKNTYDVDPNINARAPNYSSPSVTENSYCASWSASCTPLSKVTYQYDNYGQLSNQASYLYNGEEFNEQSDKAISYQLGFWGEVPKTEIMTDDVTGNQKLTNYVLTSDKKDIQSQSSSELYHGDKKVTPWKSESYTYDSKGRALSTTESWSKGAVLPNPSPDSVAMTSVTTSDSYQTTSLNGYPVLEVTHTDALGDQSVNDYRIDLANEPLIESKDALGNITKATYNALGQKISTTDAEGHTVTYSYNDSNPAENGHPTVTETYPKDSNDNSYKQEFVYNALGEEIAVKDNGNPTEKTPALDRLIETKVYNALGDVSKKTVYTKHSSNTDQLSDNQGQTTYYYDDSLGHAIESQDPLGNVSQMYIDFNPKTAQEIKMYRLNGVLVSRDIDNGLGQNIEQTEYGNPSDSSIKSYKQADNTYNGLGQLVQSISCQIPTSMNNNQTTCMTKNANIKVEGNTQYDYNQDGKKSTDHYVGFDGINLSHQYVYDLLGDELTINKEITYPKDSQNPQRSYTHQDDVNFYDLDGNLLKREHWSFKSATPEKVIWQESYSYDNDGNLLTKTRNDGTKISYDYYPNGQLKSMSYPSKGSNNTLFYQYNNQGQTTSITQSGNQSGTLSYEYALDGSLVKETYPDHKSVSYGLNSNSQVETITDEAGTVKSIHYNDDGQLSHVNYLDDTVSNYYTSKSNPDSNDPSYGLLSQMSIQGNNTEIDENNHYNGWGEILETDIANDQNMSLLQTQYTYDDEGNLSNLKESSSQSPGSSSLNLVKSYQYDSLDQLTNATTTYRSDPSPSTESTSYTLDGNLNVIGKTVTMNGNSANQTFSYNNLDQPTNVKGLSFDENGRTLSTPDGRTYSYNALDELLSVHDKDNHLIVSYSYYPDGSLATRTTPEGGTQTYYYEGGQVNAIYNKTQDTWTTFLGVNGQRIAAYTLGASKGTSSLIGSPTYYLVTNKSTSATLSNNQLTGYNYSPYGKLENSSSNNKSSLSSSENFTWNQEYNDPQTGLTYLRARFYNPSLNIQTNTNQKETQADQEASNISLFLTMDSYPSSKVDNKYAFGNANPINYYDPSGHDAVGEAFNIFNIGLNAIDILVGGAAFAAGVTAGESAPSNEAKIICVSHAALNS